MHGVGRIPAPNNKIQLIKHPKPTMYGCLVALMGLQHSYCHESFSVIIVHKVISCSNNFM
jgi:hypothetical protein